MTQMTKAKLSCPALFVAAPASGQGKTTVVAALARLHTRLGRKVRVFKCGPDFLDPQIHAIASGAPCQNVDLWMCGEADIAWRLAEAARDVDLILVEGVMGLFDGTPSAAELATRLGIPILVVINGASMANSFGAIAFGLKHYRPGTPLNAAFANCVGSAYHAELLERSLPPDIAWYGHLPRDVDAAMPERHLGLLPAAEIDGLAQRIEHMADLLASTAAAALPPAADFSDVSPPVLTPMLALTGKSRLSRAIGRDARIFLSTGRCCFARVRRRVVAGRLSRIARPGAGGESFVVAIVVSACRIRQAGARRVRRHDGLV